MTDREGRVGGGERTRRGFVRPEDVHEVKPGESGDERIRSERVDGSNARLDVPEDKYSFTPVTLLAGLPTLRKQHVFVRRNWHPALWSSSSGGHSPARAAMDDEVLAAQLEDYRKALVGINEDVRLPA